LIGIDFALGGSRELMKFLQRLDLSDLRTIRPLKKRLMKKFFPICATVCLAMRQQYEAESGASGQA
jgi:hypothetical protein